MKKCTLFIGLDDSKDTIEVAVAEGVPGGEVRDFGSVPNTPESLAKLVRRLGRPKDLFFAYEAGPCGYGTYRTLLGLGASCLVAAPSKTPRRPGERIKNDRRDARTLAKLHRASELTPIWVPDAPTEAMRDLTRAREDAKYAQTRARQRLFAFLLRHGRRYPGRTTWSAPHFRWLRTQSFDHPAQQICMEEYLLAIEEATNRVARLDQQIEQLVPQWTMRPVVRALTAHRGVNLLAASTLIAELGDLTRFDKPRTLMAFVGLVPSLTASGLERRTGRITKVNPYQCAHRPSHVGRPPMEFVHRTAVWLAAGHRTS